MLAKEGQNRLGPEPCPLPRGTGTPGPQYFLLLTPRSSQGGTVSRAACLAAPAWVGEQTVLLSGTPGAPWPDPVSTSSFRGLRFARKCRNICVLFPGLCVDLKVRTEESPVFPHPGCNQLKFFCYDDICSPCKSQRTPLLFFFFHSAQSCSGECSQTAPTRPDKLIQASSTFWPSQ